MVETLRRLNPQALGKDGGKRLIETAIDRATELQEEALEREQLRGMYSTGHPGLTRAKPAKQQRAAEDALENMADIGVRADMLKSAQAKGQNVPADQKIPPEAKSRWLLENSAKWSRTWATAGIVTDRVKHMGNLVVNNLGRLDITKEGAEQLKNDLNSLMVIKGQKPELWAKHFENGDATRLLTYHRAMTIDGQDPFEVVQRQRDLEDRREKGLTFDPPTAERLADKVSDVVSDFIDEKGEKYFGIFDKEPDSLKDLQKAAERYYLEEWERTGDSHNSRSYAMQRLNKGSVIIGNKFILGGAQLDAKSYGKNFDRYLEGLNDDDVLRRQLVTDFKLQEDFDLRTDDNRYIVNPDGSGATIFIETVTDTNIFGFGGDTIEQPIVIRIPTKPEHILPTNNEKRMESVRKNLLESRVGGSFGQQFEQIQNQ
jgi:hypothetical protein